MESRLRRRSPCGERGLKFDGVGQFVDDFQMSLPLRGAWIEIPSQRVELIMPLSLPLRGAWIEIRTGI